MSRSPLLLAVTCVTCLSVPPLLAQGKTWIVDAQGGGDFKDLPPALATARDGDTIRMRPGVYGGATTSKALTLLGDPGAKIIVGKNYPPLRVANLPAGKTFVLRGVDGHDFPYYGPGSFLELDGCLGRVHIDRVRINLDRLDRQSGSALRINNCRHVTVRDANLRAYNGLTAAGSRVALSRCVLDADDAILDPRGSNRYSAPAVDCTSSELLFTDCQLYGGNGYVVSVFLRPPSPAIQTNSSTLTISGKCVVRSGTSTSAPTSAIAGSGGRVTRDPRAVLTAHANAPLVSPGIPDQVTRLASMTASGGMLGGSLQLELLATRGDLAEVYLSLPTYPWPSPVPSVGVVWVDLASLIVLGRFQVPASELVTLTLLVPNDARLRGLALVSQAMVVNNKQLALSMPVTLVID